MLLRWLSQPTSLPAAPEYKVYYGYLHAHTGVSDGDGTPEEAYLQAKEAGLDFFGISDHDYYPDHMKDSDWRRINAAADSLNQDGDFTTLVGFEWTSDEWKRVARRQLITKNSMKNACNSLVQKECENTSETCEWSNEMGCLEWVPGHNYGHFTVVGTPSWCNAEQESCDTLEDFEEWLDSQPSGVAIFNHPGQYRSNAWNQFKFPKTDRIVGMELWNRDKDYYTQKASDGEYYYDDALRKGWRIGAGGGQDNHSDNWGIRNRHRMAILATELSRSGIMEALEARRFYSTLIDKVDISFQCNGEEMGSVLPAGEHSCYFNVNSGHGFSWFEVIKNGRVSESIPIRRKRDFPLTIDISTDVDDYIYGVLWRGDDWEVVTSPFWFSDETEES